VDGRVRGGLRLLHVGVVWDDTIVCVLFAWAGVYYTCFMGVLCLDTNLNGTRILITGYARLPPFARNSARPV
jgi:hypothetical protein